MIASKSSPNSGRMAAVQDMAAFLRKLFEIERAFVATATTLIPRVGNIEMKYLLCQHVWESAGHARLLRERGREMIGFGKGESVREPIRVLFEEAIRPSDGLVALAEFYRALKPALRKAYQDYLDATHHLADWPSRHLVSEFIADETRHLDEIAGFLDNESGHPESQCLAAKIEAMGGLLGEASETSAVTRSKSYQHPKTCNRGSSPVCSTVFGHDPAEDPIVREWLEDPNTDARVIRIMVYVWLMMELDAVDYLSTLFYDLADAPFDLHYDLARHLWDESRHSAFGYRQLPRLGVDLNTLEHSLDLYNILIEMSPAQRYAMMTMEFEAGSFATKAKIMDRIRELNDFEADTLLAFDRNDEQNHVRYGHRWLPEILRLSGEPGSIEEFVAATKKRFAELEGTIGGSVPHALPAIQRLTAEKISAIARAC